ncbi:MRP-L47-domain-containing protein [Amniculicola lignicola CBS 123094]|uniref:Large ribosomal subunit protein uL29m n=1 Tax=Amniculicola lignicola CBS 123094 TaxID=1392246 RepID=A0A6A5WQ69_9PLEO|nr:MRP-L47-domain-containing protein [Amniculicola lignicola CBS 123094]
MAAIPTLRTVRPCLTSTTTNIIFPFLAPSLLGTSITSRSVVAQFSTSPTLLKRDNNRNRGVSVLRSTGFRKRQTLSRSVTVKNLPKPVLDPSQKSTWQGSDEHGLWEFFKDRKLLQTPSDEWAHGREWKIHELRRRSWEDLHQLWWVCMKERNRLATEKIERARQKLQYGDQENKERDETVCRYRRRALIWTFDADSVCQVQKTMRAIEDTLVERQKAWRDALELAQDDPEVDLSGSGPAYVETPYVRWSSTF